MHKYIFQNTYPLWHSPAFKSLKISFHMQQWNFFSFRLSIIKFDVLKRHLLTLYIEHSLTIINSNLWMWIWSTIALYTLTSSSKLVGLCVLSLDYRTIPKLHSSVNFFNHELSRNNEQFLGHCTTQMREILQFFLQIIFHIICFL